METAEKKGVIVIDKGISIKQDKAIDIFSDPKLLKPYLEKVAKAVTVDPAKVVVNTDKGRKEIGSRSHRVSKIKVALTRVGKDSVIDLKAKVQAVNEGIKQGYKKGNLRKSIVSDPAASRKNTNTNTPAVIHCEIVPGEKLEITVMPKCFGSENVSRLKMLNPAP